MRTKALTGQQAKAIASRASPGATFVAKPGVTPGVVRSSDGSFAKEIGFAILPPEQQLSNDGHFPASIPRRRAL